MKKFPILVLILTCILTVLGCSNKNTPKTDQSAGSFTVQELPFAEDREPIGNQIPQWVSDADWEKPLYVVSSSDLERFDAFALEDFPGYCDAGWTQEQSDAVYLGQGIDMFILDDEMQINRIVYYPVILNGVIVGGYQVWEQLDNQKMGMQASPLLADELNTMMELATEDTPLILGYNNDNTIGIIGDTCYVLEIDHMEHKAVKTDKIPAIASDTCINAMEVLCTERTADVNDWVMYDRK